MKTQLGVCGSLEEGIKFFATARSFRTGHESCSLSEVAGMPIRNSCSLAWLCVFDGIENTQSSDGPALDFIWTGG